MKLRRLEKEIEGCQWRREEKAKEMASAEKKHQVCRVACDAEGNVLRMDVG